MFISRKRYELDRESDARLYSSLLDRFWSLHHKHERLLSELGLQEQEIRKTVLVKKGGPERGGN